MVMVIMATVTDMATVMDTVTTMDMATVMDTVITMDMATVMDMVTTMDMATVMDMVTTLDMATVMDMVTTMDMATGMVTIMDTDTAMDTVTTKAPKPSNHHCLINSYFIYKPQIHIKYILRKIKFDFKKRKNCFGQTFSLSLSLSHVLVISNLLPIFLSHSVSLSFSMTLSSTLS